MEKKHVISVGGSILAPNGVDINFLQEFIKTIRKYHKKHHKFAIFVGGGAIARDYIDSAKKMKVYDSNLLDEIGIKATLLNAEILRTALNNISVEQVYRNPIVAASEPDEKIVVCGGWKPGWSTDYDAVVLAEKRGISTVINLTNVDYVYDKNPNKYKDARKIKVMKWNEMLEISGNTWKPGLSLPFDPKASKLAAEKGIKVIIANGNNIKNLENILSSKPFIGTTIS